MEAELEYANALLRSFKNDSALIVAQQLLKELKQQGQYNSAFALRVRLAEANALERDQQGAAAIERLLPLVEECAEKSMWDVFAGANLSLALLYESIGLKENSLTALQAARNAIDDHGLDSIYPYYAIRMASWQRIYNNQDTAIYFALEALRTAPLYGQGLEEAIGHMLMNMLLPKTAVTERLTHCFAGVRLYEKLEDHTGCSFMYGAIADIFFQKQDLQKALLYNDSTIMAANRAIAAGHEQLHSLGGALSFRGEIFKIMGQWDSAWSYQNQGFAHQMDFMKRDARDKVVEISARYDNEKKTQELEEKNLEIRLRKTQVRYSLAIAVLILLLAAGLFFGFIRQRDGRRQLERQHRLIIQQGEQLKAQDAAKSRFFANISHELRTPLTLMLGPVNTLINDHRLGEKEIRLLQMARRNGVQLNQLINEILDLRKLEMEKMDVQLEPTILLDFFAKHIAQFESLAASKQINFSIDAAVAPELCALIDPEKYRQILYNLLSNAFKFTPAGGQVVVRLSDANDRLELSVSDTGPGIHPDDLPHVFDRFFQTSRPDKPAEGGTGIGLNLCREYARLLGGDISVESTLGRGASFHVAFPLTPAEIPAAMPPADMPTAPLWPGARTGITPDVVSEARKPALLVVEDNPDLQAYIRIVLQGRYQVSIAQHGRDALGQLKSGTPCDLVVSDLMMPVMDGYQLLERLKSDDSTRHLPVIMLTARAEARDRLTALRLGVDDYLTKPFDEEELLARIDNLLKNQEARRAAADEEGDAPPDTPELSQSDRDWLERFERFVQQHFSEGTLTVSWLAHEFAMSESTLLRQMKRLTGLTPQQYLQEVRLEEARHLLENRMCGSVSEVAAKIGYADARALTRNFRARFGKLPSDWLEA